MTDPSEKLPPRDLDQRFVQHLRQKSKREQPLDRKPVPPDPKEGSAAVGEKHRKPGERPLATRKETIPTSPKRGATPDPDDPTGGDKSAKRRKSPPPSPGNQATASGARHPPQRSRARTSETPRDFDAAPRDHNKTLWHDGSPALTRASPSAARGAGPHHNINTNNPRGGPSSPAHRRGQGSHRGGGVGVGGGHATAGGDAFDHVNELEKQPETRPISQEQLVAEVKGIYAGLVMVESRCIEVDNAQTSISSDADAPPLSNDQWQALIALHRELLNEHHDFFLASQHPSAGPALRRLATKYAMPARMWRHGIHSFLEVLRHRLPYSAEHMLSFIYLAYSMMALLYETVPGFEDTWIECLGDLSRYRMAIEDDDIHDRNVWTAVSRSWYSKASDRAPTTGRLHHHLAILARPNIVTQLFYYLKSLCVAIPFDSARESILTLFKPILEGVPNKSSPVDRAFVKIHSVFFTGEHANIFDEARNEFFSGLDLEIAKNTRKWLEPGYQIAIANICAILGHGLKTNVFMEAIAASRTDDAASDTSMEGGQEERVELPQQALQFSEATDLIVFARLGDLNILSYLHMRLFFMHAMAPLGSAMKHLEGSFPWHLLTLALNSFIPEFEHPETYEAKEFPTTIKKALPEDWALRGLVWAEQTFPPKHFEFAKAEDDERMLETPSLADQRRERILWLACRIAEKKRWILYDGESRRFSPAPEWEKADIDIRPPTAPSAQDDEEILPDADATSTVGGGPSERPDDDSPQEPSQPPAAPVTIIQPDREGRGDK